MKIVQQCPRCIRGQVGMDWDGRVCIQCGYRPDDKVESAKEAVLRREAGKREPRIPR